MTASTIPPRIRAHVLARDRYRCIAVLLDPHCGICRDAFGNPILRWSDRDPGPIYLQMSHEKDEGELAMSMKATPDPQHLVSLCPGHHTGTVAGSNWEAVHRDTIRRWLRERYPRIVE